MSDEEAMEALSKGNLEKAAILFERYQQRMYNFFVKMSFDRELSQDLAQNLFLRLIRYRGSFVAGMPFRPWLYQMARNLLNDHYSQQKMRFSDFTDLEAIGREAAEMLEEAGQAEQEKALQKALSLLEAEHREILVLSKFQKLKYHEIARIMQCTEGSVKVKVHRAIKKLRGLYFMIESQ